MKINIVTDIESHPRFNEVVSQNDVYGLDLQKVIIAATDLWGHLSVGSISVGFSPTLDMFLALKD